MRGSAAIRFLIARELALLIRVRATGVVAFFGFTGLVGGATCAMVLAGDHAGSLELPSPRAAAPERTI